MARELCWFRTGGRIGTLFLEIPFGGTSWMQGEWESVGRGLWSLYCMPNGLSSGMIGLSVICPSWIWESLWIFLEDWDLLLASRISLVWGPGTVWRKAWGSLIFQKFSLQEGVFERIVCSWLNCWCSGYRKRVPKADGIACFHYIHYPGIQFQSFPVPPRPRKSAPYSAGWQVLGRRGSGSLEEVT